LQLHGVRAGARGGVDQRERALHAPVVVGRELGDDLAAHARLRTSSASAASCRSDSEYSPLLPICTRRWARLGARSRMRRTSAASCEVSKSASLFSIGRKAFPSWSRSFTIT